MFYFTSVFHRCDKLLKISLYVFSVPSLDTKDRFDIATVLGVLIGCVFALLLFTVIILQYLKTRSSRRDGSQAMRPGFLAVKEKVTLPLRTEADDLFEKDDKNPDVIPSNKGE